MNYTFLKTQTLRERKIAIKKALVSTSTRTILLAIVVIVGILHISQISSISTTGYDVSKLQKQALQLERELNSIEYQIALNRSMESIEKRLAAMEFTSVDTVAYVHGSSLNAVVAQR